MKKLIFSFVLAMIAVGVQAKIELPSYLASNMVLQQQSEVKLWGWAEKGHKVTVTTSWDKHRYTTTASQDGEWTVAVRTIEAGGPYEITITDGEKLTLTNVLLGEVWFCSGQSNMEMPMKGFDRQPMPGGNKIFPLCKPSTPIRMFLADKDAEGRWMHNWSKTPERNVYGRWMEHTPEGVAETSATAYFFARYIQQVLEVPVAVIVSSLGGARIEPFISKEGLQGMPDVRWNLLDADDDKINAYDTPTILYNGKVAPFTNIPVRGFLWYQGESNRNNAHQYAELMRRMVKDWREKWGLGELPFYFVEIAPFDYGNPQEIGAALLREAQVEAWQTIPNSGLASTLDAGNHNHIHCFDKETVGTRLALWALGNTYGKTGFGYKPAVYQSKEIKDGKIYINYENGGNGLCPMWTSLEGYEIAGEDGVFHPAFAEIEEKTCRLCVSSKDVPNPVHVRYAFHNWATASTYNIQGLPLLPFRTDK